MSKPFSQLHRRDTPRRPKAVIDVRTGTPGRPALEPLPRMRWYG